MTLIFTDLVGSTRLLSPLAPHQAEAVRQDHFGLLRGVLSAHGGEEVKNLGDGLMVAFKSARDAVRCAVAMQRAVDSHSRGADVGLGMRIGLATGDAVADGADWFGTPVVEAARLCSLAEGGQIIVTDVVRSLVAGAGSPVMESLGELALRGLSDPVLAWRVDWDAPPTAARVVVADDAVLVREGIVRLLERAGLEVVGQADDGDELLSLVALTRPDVVVTDVRMPPTFSVEGLEAAERIGAEHPGVGILVLSQQLERAHADRVLDCGSAGAGYLMKERVADVSAFLDAVRRVAAGERVLGELG